MMMLIIIIAHDISCRGGHVSHGSKHETTWQHSCGVIDHVDHWIMTMLMMMIITVIMMIIIMTATIVMIMIMINSNYITTMMK